MPGVTPLIAESEPLFNDPDDMSKLTDVQIRKRLTGKVKTKQQMVEQVRYARRKEEQKGRPTSPYTEEDALRMKARRESRMEDNAQFLDAMNNYILICLVDSACESLMGDINYLYQLHEPEQSEMRRQELRDQRHELCRTIMQDKMSQFRSALRTVSDVKAKRITKLHESCGTKAFDDAYHELARQSTPWRNHPHLPYWLVWEKQESCTKQVTEWKSVCKRREDGTEESVLTTDGFFWWEPNNQVLVAMNMYAETLSFVENPDVHQAIMRFLFVFDLTKVKWSEFDMEAQEHPESTLLDEAKIAMDLDEWGND